MVRQENIVDPLVFRLYDIRGIVGTQITPEVAELIGQAYGTIVRKRGHGNARIVVGRDNRASSLELQSSLMSGLKASGCYVIDIGLASSPLMYFFSAYHELEGGINVTGSHNPLDQNGFKLVGPKAYPFAEEDIQLILDIINNKSFIDGKGKITTEDPKTVYFTKLKELIHIKRPLKIVIDCGNAVMGIYAPEFLRQIGCNIIELYCGLDSNFPHHVPNPENPDNMKDLQANVLKVGADIGIAFDGDGDRVGIVDELGNRHEADYITALISKDLITRHPGVKVLIDVKSSQSVLEYIAAQGGQPILTKVGHSLIKKRMHEEGIILGGETSGHIFISENYYPIDDALFAACRILEILSRQQRTLSSLFSDIPHQVITPMIEVYCPDRDKFNVIQEVTEYFSSKYEVITIDGARIVFSDGWALVRASNTTPSLTLRFEAESTESLKRIQSIIYNKLKEFKNVKLPEDH